MISKDLQTLINKYNEIGFFTLISNKIYWYNGKRFELWYEFYSDLFRILYHKNKLYCCCVLGLLYIFRNKHFITISNTACKILDLFQNNTVFAISETNQVYTIKNDKLYCNQQMLTMRNFGGDPLHMLTLMDKLYFFFQFGYEVYDLKTMICVITKPLSLVFITSVHLFQEKIYIWDSNTSKFIVLDDSS